MGAMEGDHEAVVNELKKDLQRTRENMYDALEETKTITDQVTEERKKIKAIVNRDAYALTSSQMKELAGIVAKMIELDQMYASISAKYRLLNKQKEDQKKTIASVRRILGM